MIRQCNRLISARPYKVFLYHPDEVWDRTGYVEQNPLKENLPAQQWEFVVPCDNFPFHKHKDAKAQAEARSRSQRRGDR